MCSFCTSPRVSRRAESFLQVWPEYSQTHSLDTLRETDFRRLDAQRHVYLDYTGGGLYGESQILQHCEMLRGQIFGNPHSLNPASARTSELVEACRRHVLEYFRADPEEYIAVFTANASHALKLVGESYPFERGDQFLLTYDNHNSVNGIREFDRAHGAKTTYVPMVPPFMRVDDETLERHLERSIPGRHNLFAFPAQSNFSGVQHPLEWIERAHAHGWDVLLDAAAFVPTNRLDLSRYHPDYVALSFYKMFGYPTGVGALLMRRSALAKLHRPWFAGGTITVASVQADRFFLAPGAEAFEDGTLDYTNIPAVETGLRYLAQADVDLLHKRLSCLGGWLLHRLATLSHSSGQPLVALYGPDTMERRGATFALNLRRPDGSLIDHSLVERRAAEQAISIRTGCFCNPGAGEQALGLSREDVLTCVRGHEDRMTYDDFRHCITDKGSGAVRVSLGLVSNFEDVETFVSFLEGFLE